MTCPSERQSNSLVERIFRCIHQYEGVGASASEVSDELQLPLHEIIEHVRVLAKEERVLRTRTLRPWKNNVSKDLAEMRRVFVAAQFREEAI
jgi:hypothetical protein